MKTVISYLAILLTLTLISCETEEPQMNTQPEVYMKFFGGAYDETLIEALPLPNEETLLLGTEYRDDQPNSMFLVRADQYGNYLWQTWLRDVGDGVAASDLILDGDRILVMGHVQADNSSNLLLWTLDLEGQSLDTMYVGSVSQNERNGHLLINNDSSGYTVVCEVWENNRLTGNIVGNLNPTAADLGSIWDVKQEGESSAKTVIGIERLSSGQIVWVGANNDVDEGDTNTSINVISPDGIYSSASIYANTNNALDRIRGFYQFGGRLFLAGATNESGQMKGHIINFGLNGDQVVLYDTISATKDTDYELVGFDELDNGNIVVCGYQMAGGDDMDQYLAEWDSEGNIVWEEEAALGNPYGDTDMAHRVKAGSDYLLLFGETGLVNNQAICLMRSRLNGDMH